MHCTDVERPKAKKPHRCMSCGEGIAVGETYVRWLGLRRVVTFERLKPPNQN